MICAAVAPRRLLALLASGRAGPGSPEYGPVADRWSSWRRPSRDEILERFLKLAAERRGLIVVPTAGGNSPARANPNLTLKATLSRPG